MGDGNWNIKVEEEWMRWSSGMKYYNCDWNDDIQEELKPNNFSIRRVNNFIEWGQLSLVVLFIWES